MKKLIFLLLILLVPAIAFGNGQPGEEEKDAEYNHPHKFNHSDKDRNDDDGTEYYISMGAALAFPNSISAKNPDGKLDLHTGFRGQLAIGLEIKEKVRMEMEYALRNSGLDSVDSEAFGLDNENIDGNAVAHSLMFNTYYSFGESTSLSPYIGGGFGTVWEEITVDNLGWSSESANQDGFAFQWMGGITSEITDDLYADLEYRYFDGVDAKSHEVGINLRHEF